jgi:thiamine-phosphate diphosphorylase
MNREAGAADRPLFPSPLYAIFDPSQSRGRPLSTILQDLLAGGVGIIQLRAKETAAKEFLRLAREMRGLTRPAGCLFIVNDRLDIALAAQADGVHLGQEDLPLAIARKLMGREKIIGISTHDLAQAKEAERGGADYIGFGPIFGTFTKDTGYSPRGLAMLKEIRKAVKIPIVAIGGITENNIPQVREAGADAAAIISDLMGAEDVAGKVKRILALRQTL